MKKLKPIRTSADHTAALVLIDKLMDAKKGTPEGRQFDALVAAVQDYEQGERVLLPKSTRTSPYARKHSVMRVYTREDGSKIYSVWLVVGVQSFRMGYYDDRDDDGDDTAENGAKFTQKMLAIALTKLIEGA